MFRRQRISVVLSLTALTLAACGGAAVPQDKLTAAQAAVRAAEVGGAGENPQAALHLKYARDQIAEAQRLIEDDENEAAAALVARAELDAELALALARVEEAKAEARVARKLIQDLKSRLTGQ